MSAPSSPGRVDKVIQIVAASSQSWEHAAQNAVAEAANSIRDLNSARVLERDMAIVDGGSLFRIKLEVAFQVDRSRIEPSGEVVEVTRFLVVADRTLENPALLTLVRDTLRSGGAEFHIVVPRSAPSVLHADPATGLIGPAAHSMVTESRESSRLEGEARLAAFREAVDPANDRLSGEVMLTDPLTAVRTVMGRSSFDEIVISTLPSGVSRWLKMDLPSRVERAFSLPVTRLVYTDST